MAVNMTAPQRRRTVSSEAELPDYYRPLSLALYQIMEDVGANAEIRNMWQERFATSEILWTVARGTECPIYHFGSSREGTSIIDMFPDIDTVFVDNRFPVITDCSAVSGQESLLLVHDNDTQAGYAKLQLVYNGVPLFRDRNKIYFHRPLPMDHCTDKYNRLVVAFNPELTIFHGSERHGPAIFLNDPFRLVTSDTVYAFNVSSLPGCVEEWITRTRNYNWPPVDVIDRCKTLGCLLVPVGHPHSDEKHLEWRLALSHQERFLVSQFNSVQHKCYILMKLWKKDVLPLWIRQESLSSYHCKTCMFYMIENTPSDFWRPDNLLGCFVACLKLFLFWTTNGILPNYFIPAENMFDRRINRKLQYDLQQALQNMLTQDCKYLTQISTSHIGDRLLSCVTMPNLCRQYYPGLESWTIEFNFYFLVNMGVCVFFHRHNCMQTRLSNSSEQWLINLNNFSRSLKQTTRITKHTEEETQCALSYIVPYLDLYLMTDKIALAKQQGRSREEIWRLLFCDTWNQLSLTSDISAKLKQASLMYMFGYHHASLDVLSSIELSGRYSQCWCYLIPTVPFPTADDLISVLNQPDVTTECMLHRLFVSCIIFLPTERSVTPDALCYEMLRYLDDPLRNADGLEYNYLRECAVVDGPFLFHFLLYLNHSKLNMRSHVRADIDNMIHTIYARGLLNMPKCSHREACLNILGWVYKDQGCVETAVQCFRRSLEVKRRGNAATRHLRDLENTSQ